MKIAYVLNCYPQPSQSFIWREIAALEQQGASVTRIAMRRPSDAPAGPRDGAERERTSYVLDRGAPRLLRSLAGCLARRPVATLRAFGLAWRCGGASQAGRLRHLIYLAEGAEVARQCRDQGIPHMHAHFGTNSAAVAMLASALGGPGYSFTVHGPEEFDAPADLSLGEKLRHASFAVGVSQFGRSQLCRWMPVDQWHKIKVVHCGIETDTFRDPGPMPDLPLRLVSVGRFSEQKGQAVLIEAMARIRSKRPDITLTLVGDGPLRPTLEALITKHDLGTQVTLTGWLDEAQVRAQLVAAHMMVMPSFAEGLPVAIMESMAAGRPVIASQIAGIPELVRDAQTGWLVAPGDADALADRILQVADMPLSQLQSIGLAARQCALDRHDVAQEAAKLAALFAQTPAD